MSEFAISRLALGASLLFAIGSFNDATAQHAAHAVESDDQVSPDQLPPARRMTHIGNAHIPITSTPEAQRWFDQGLNLLHDFWEYEAARAFQQGIRADPACAMCYWGLGRALVASHSTSQGYAFQAFQRAAALRDRITERERLYLDMDVAAPPKRLDTLRRLVEKYPEDTQAKIFLATSVADGFDAAGPRSGQQESLAILEDVMRRDRKSAAARHYYVHALESADPGRARVAAMELARLAPASGHIVHMPGHIFYRLGEYARAERAFAASLAIDERYMRDQHVVPDDNWNYVHNLMYAVANLLEQGKFRAATRMSGRIPHARGRHDSTMYTYVVRDSMSRLDPMLPVALRSGDWEDVVRRLDARTPTDKPNLEFLAASLRDVASAMLALERDDIEGARTGARRLDDARRERAAIATASPAAPVTRSASGTPQRAVMPDALLPPIMATLSVMSRELGAAILLAEGEHTRAKAGFREAELEEMQLGYREPPMYIRPVPETEGARLLARQDWAGARTAYERALAARPRSGFALFGIARSAEGAGETVAAVAAYRDFLRAWRLADRDRPEIRHARGYLASHH